MKKKWTKSNGFTLAELLIVVAIIAVLVAISIPIFTSQLEKAREATDLSDVRFHSKTTALRWPTYIQGLALPAGAVFMGIRTIQAAYQQLKEGRQK